MSGRVPGSPRRPSSRHPRSSGPICDRQKGVTPICSDFPVFFRFVPICFSSLWPPAVLRSWTIHPPIPENLLRLLFNFYFARCFFRDPLKIPFRTGMKWPFLRLFLPRKVAKRFPCKGMGLFQANQGGPDLLKLRIFGPFSFVYLGKLPFLGELSGKRPNSVILGGLVALCN